MFAGTIPATIEWVVEKAGLLIYSSRISPAKGGPLLTLGACYPWRREHVPPLSVDESNALLTSLSQQLVSKGYKLRAQIFCAEGISDHNDFRIRIILKEREVNASDWNRIKLSYRERSRFLRHRAAYDTRGPLLATKL